MVDEYSDIALLRAVPFCIAKPLLKLLRQKSSHFLMSNMKYLDAYEYLLMSSNQSDLQKDFVKLWHTENLDGLICPAFMLPAVPHGKSSKLAIAAYSLFLNY
jgi:hypothetical protein